MAATKKITYLGPKDAREPATIYRLPGGEDGEDLVLSVGIPVDATEAQVRALRKDKAHRFEAGKAEASEADPNAPWTDYADLTAEDVVERLGDPELTPNAEVAAAVRDYEAGRKDARKTIIDAAEHQRLAYDPANQQEGG